MGGVSLGQGQLKIHEIKLLKENPFVLEVNRRRIIYSLTFKKRFIEEYNSGKLPTQIFRDAGFDPRILGPKRIERSAARWRQAHKEGKLGAYENKRHSIKNVNT